MRASAAVSLVPGTRPLDRDLPLLTPAQVSELLQCSPRTVMRLDIPSVKLGEKKLRRYRPQDVREWLDAQIRGTGR